MADKSLVEEYHAKKAMEEAKMLRAWLLEKIPTDAMEETEASCEDLK